MNRLSTAVYDAHGTLADYVECANDATLIAIQLEEQAAIDNIDELIAVDGIDVFFIGPSDLSQSMGHPSNPQAPVVAQAIDASFRKRVTRGRIPGTPAVAESVREVLDKGVRNIYTHLPRLLASTALCYCSRGKPSSVTRVIAA